jgi:hypothetical protein
MPIYTFEAMDATGEEIRDVIEAPSEEEAQATIRQMGYFITKITCKSEKIDPSGYNQVATLWIEQQRKSLKFDFNKISNIALRCIVALICAILLLELAKNGTFNHNLFIEAILLAIYNKLIK